jgi:hypothetical protein
VSDAVIVNYEACPECTDGACRKCGLASSEHAAPGVRLVIRHVRFVRCAVCNGTGSFPAAGQIQTCASCGPTKHEMASPGVTVEIADEHSRKRWVPSIHLEKNGRTACGHGWSGQQLTSDRAKVTCKRCLKWGAR